MSDLKPYGSSKEAAHRPGELPPSFEEAMRGTADAPSTSNTTTQPPSTNTSFACVSLNETNKIRFISFPEDDVTALCAIILRSWPKGVESLRPYGLSQEVRLKGNPWAYSGQDAPRRLVRDLLAGLYERGWILQAGVNLIEKRSSNDTLMFRRQAPRPPCDWLVVLFDGGNRLIIVDTLPEDVCSAVQRAFEGVIMQTPGKWFLRTSQKSEVKFKSEPWKPEGTDTVKTRLLLLGLFGALEGCGYSLYGSIGQGWEKQEPDVLYFTKQRR